MMNFIFALIYSISLGYSSEDCLRPLLQLDSSVENLIQLDQKITACSPQYKKDYLALFGSQEPLENRKVIGQTISGTKFELDTLDQILGIYREDATLIETGKPFYHDTPETWAEAAKVCKNVSCMLVKVFPDEESAYRVLNIAKKTGYVISLANSEIDQKPVKKNWNLEEIKQIEKALNFLPPELYKMKSLNTFKKVNINSRQCPGGTVAFYDMGTIVYCDSGTSKLSKVTLHEIGHCQDFNGQYLEHGHLHSHETGFNDISGWKEGPLTKKNNQMYSNEIYSDSSSFVSDYAKTNSLEDYAESFANYIDNPRELKAVSPKKYALMKEKIFKGKEYLTPELNLNLEKTFAVEELITDIIPQCLAKLDAINLDRSKATYGMKKQGPSKDEKGNCSKDVDVATRDRFSRLSEAEKCKIESIEEIKNYINFRVDKALESMLSSLLPSPEGDERFKSLYKKDCFSKKDLTAKCYFNVLSKNSSTALSRWDNKKASQLQIIENLERMTAKNQATMGLQKPAFEMLDSEKKVTWSKTKIYKECIAGVETISFPYLLAAKSKMPQAPQPPGGEFANVSQNISSPIKLSAFCEKYLKNKSKNFGYAMDENGAFESILAESIGRKLVIYPFSNFDNAVLKKVADKSKECNSLSGQEVIDCQKQSLKESISKWAVDSGLDPAEFVEEKFLSELNSKFQW